MLGEISVPATLAAAVASFAFGALWYSPPLLLGPWSRAAGVDPKASMSNPARVFGLTAVFTVVAAFAFSVYLGPDPDPSGAIVFGLVVGACFAGCSMGINYQFAGRGGTMWAIDAGFHTLRFAIMGAVIGFWP